MRNVRELLILSGVICVTSCSSTSINNNLVFDSAGGSAPLASSIGGATTLASTSNAIGGAATGGETASSSGGLAASGGERGSGLTSSSSGSPSGGTTGLMYSATGGLAATTSLSGNGSTGGSSGLATGGIPGSGGTSAANSSLPVGGMSANVGGTVATFPMTGGTAATTGGMATGGAMTTTSGSAAMGGSATGGEPATGGATGAIPLLEKCTLLLHMDETSWSGSAGEVMDSSGAANNGTAVGATTTAVPSKFGRAGQFPGGGYVRMASSDTLHALSAFTIAAWIYPTGLIDDSVYSMGVVTKRSGYQDRTEFAFFIWHDGAANIGQHLYVDIQGEESRCASTAQLVNERWYHVALVFDGALPASERVRIYINGQLDSVHYEASSSVTQYDSPVEVGRLQNGGETFIGTIDEVAMWQRPLSQLEISSLYVAAEALQ